MREPVELSVGECRGLLSCGLVGRVALATPVGPRIVPVNYALYDEAIVFRTSPYSELASYGPGRDAAFEVDNLDYQRQQGWSVVALGRLEPVEPADQVELRKVWEPQPWAGGHRTLYLKLPWRELSGRRIGALDTPTPVRRVV